MAVCTRTPELPANGRIRRELSSKLVMKGSAVGIRASALGVKPIWTLEAARMKRRRPDDARAAWAAFRGDQGRNLPNHLPNDLRVGGREVRFGSITSGTKRSTFVPPYFWGRLGDVVVAWRGPAQPWSPFSSDGRLNQVRRAVPLRQGAVLGAVSTVVAASAVPLRVIEVQAQVEGLLGRPVPRSTVNEALSTHSRGRKPRFARVGRGLRAVRVTIRHRIVTQQGRRRILRRQRTFVQSTLGDIPGSSRCCWTE